MDQAARYTRAIEQLGATGEDKADVRLGGIYALERIALDSRRDQPAIVAVLCAFIRHHGHGPGAEVLEGPVIPGEWLRPDRPEALQEYEPPIDVQAAATVVSRLPRLGSESESIDLSGAHLERTLLAGQDIHLEFAILRGAHLVGADLDNVHLEHADLEGAHLEYAQLVGAQLQSALLEGTHLEHANIDGASLAYANLKGAHLEYVNRTIKDVKEGQPIWGVEMDLTGANLSGAHLESANLSDASGLSQDQLEKAFGDGDTRLPGNVTRPSSWGLSAQKGEGGAKPTGVD